MSQPEQEKAKLEKRTRLFSGLAWTLAIGGLVPLTEIGKFRPFNMTNLANIGQFIGGISGPIWGLAGFVLIYVAFLGQKVQILQQSEELALNRQEIEQTRNELRGQKLALEESNVRQETERFEKNLFELLSLLRASVVGVQIKIKKNSGEVVYSGITALREWGNLLGVMWRNTRTDDPLERLNAAFEEFHATSSTYLNHHFRTFVFIIKSIENTKLQSKEQYLDLVFSSLSTYELTIFYYRGLTRFGKEIHPYLARIRRLIPDDHILDPAFELSQTEYVA